MYAGGPETTVSRRNLLMAGMSVAVWTAASMVQGCGSETVNQIGGTTSVPAPADLGTGNVTGPTPPAFVQPAVLSSVGGALSTTLVHRVANNMVGATPVTLRSYNGQLTGPTLRVKPGDTLRILVDNQFPANPDPVKPANINQPHQLNTTNLHTHGLHVSPQANSDNIFVEIDPGETFQYEYQIPADHPPGTMWYHPHKHGSSSVQLFSSMAGALIIEGGLDEVPAIKAARDLVFLITELNIDGTGQVPNWAMATPTPFTQAGRRLLVNGQLTPTLSAFSGEVIRLRVINGSVRTAVPFSIPGHTLNIISLDGIALPAMRQANSIVITPAGRADILIRCGAPGNYDIQRLADDSLGNLDSLILLGTLNVLNTVVNMALPDKLPPQPYPNILDAELTSNVVTVLNWELGAPGAEAAAPGFNGQNFTINLFHFNPMVVNQSVPLNSVLEWELVNTSTVGHPFHIHINPFMVVSVNNVAVEPEWHDTFNIPKGGRIRIRHRFEDFRGLYVLHCHILVHEDLGMMQVVEVT